IIHTEVQGNATTGQTAQKEIYSLLDLMLGTYAQENNKTVVKPLPGIYTFEVTLVYKTGLIQVGEINPQNISFKDYIGINKFQLTLTPSCYGFFGTDPYGRPLGLGLLMGVPVAFYLGLSVSFISTLIGALYGTLAGYWKDIRGEALMRVADIVVSLPFLPILIVIGAVLGQISINLLIFLMVILFWAGPVIVIRSAALQISEQLYIEAARASGVGTARIIFRHIFPQVLPYTLAIAVLSIPGIIVTEAGLSLLGFGDPTLPTWGKLLEQAYSAQAVTNGLWWTYLFPGLALVWFSAAFLLIGRSLEPIVAPKLQK
ncbi:MAG: ABC transporter permease, partial [Desulfurococcales archaeon]|nr:ABC transporter permease [Desulfurococcales archaeon]